MNRRLKDNLAINLKVLEQLRPDLLRIALDYSDTKSLLEKAVDGNYTCKIEYSTGQLLYLYSRYKPLETARKNIEKIKISECGNYLMLGLGLGYELKELYKLIKNDFKQIIIIEKEPELFSLYLKVGDYREILADKRITFVIGSYNSITIPTASICIIENPNIMIDRNFYKNVIKKIGLAIKKEILQNIVVFDHVTFADDVCIAFKELGFNVIKMSYLADLDLMATNIKEIAPLFIFSINYNKYILRIAEYINIPYVSWTVDTPSLSLFNEKNKSPWALFFIYERDVVENLRKAGFTNVFYLPAAANVTRFENIEISPEESERYSCDISFVGSTGFDNEFQKFYSGNMEQDLAEEIEEIIFKQLIRPNEFLIPKLIANYYRKMGRDIAQLVYQQSGIRLDGDNFISDDQRFAYVLAKEACARWRYSIIKKISSLFSIHLYGDEGWGLLGRTQENIVFGGFAEHFLEVPKVYKSSKINLNLTRIYVQSGLPMRVFDTLAAGGFLLTNHKKDLDLFFESGKDIVIFHNDKEMMEAIEYYLNYQEEREAIALRGYEKVKKKHTFTVRMQEVLNIFRRNYSVKGAESNG